MSHRSLVALGLLGAAVAACSSPEATRMRAGGPGSDVGNRGDVELHGGSAPYHGTPTAGRELVPRPQQPRTTAQ